MEQTQLKYRNIIGTANRADSPHVDRPQVAFIVVSINTSGASMQYPSKQRYQLGLLIPFFLMLPILFDRAMTLLAVTILEGCTPNGQTGLLKGSCRQWIKNSRAEAKVTF